MYGKIENGKVVEFFRELPRVIDNTSLGKNITDEELKEFGILPVVGISLPLEEWQTYGTKNYTVLENKIEERKEILEETLDNYKSKKITQLSDKCKSDILSKYSYEEQTNLMREGLRLQFMLNTGQEVDNERVIYIANADAEIEARRAEYKTQKETLLSYTSYEEVRDYVNSLFPNKQI